VSGDQQLGRVLVERGAVGPVARVARVGTERPVGEDDAQAEQDRELAAVVETRRCAQAPPDGDEPGERQPRTGDVGQREIDPVAPRQQAAEDEQQRRDRPADAGGIVVDQALNRTWNARGPVIAVLTCPSCA
jgi:hypothetical protein